MSKINKKILLPSEDILSRESEDLFININLNRNFDLFKKEKFDNDFNLLKQFQRERDSSRNFYIYGIVDSNVIDCDNLEVEVYWSSNTSSNYFVTSGNTSSLVYNQENVFGKKRGKYLLNINTFSASNQTTAYILIRSNNLNYKDQIWEQPLVFYNDDGEFVSYGNETIEISLNGNFVEVSNNFPFFYNKHWVKKNLKIEELKFAEVSFSDIKYEIEENNSTTVIVTLDRPSEFGIEKVDFNILSGGTASLNDYFINAPTSFSWNIGEQIKSFTFSANNDTLIELPENVIFSLSNFDKVNPGDIIQSDGIIKDITPKYFTTFNFGYAYNNRLPFTGSVSSVIGNNIIYTPSQSILRNGYFFEKKNEEFYPNDKFILNITNSGDDTLLPIIPGVTNIEENWPAGTIKTLEIESKYLGTSKEKIELEFPYETQSDYLTIELSPPPYGNPVFGGVFPYVSINGTLFQASSSELFESKISAYNTTDKPYILYRFGKKVFVTSTNPGVPLDVFTNVTAITKNEVTQFTPSEQIPFELTLYGNTSSGLESSYDFSIEKPGYDNISIQAYNIPAGTIPVTRNLVTSFDNIRRAYDISNNSCVYTTGYTSIPVGEAWIKGFLLLSNNSLNSSYFNPLEPQASTGNYAAFFTNPLTIIPCTNSDTYVNSISKKIYLHLTGTTTTSQIFSIDVDAYNTNSFTTYQVQYIGSLTTTAFNMIKSPSAGLVTGGMKDLETSGPLFVRQGSATSQNDPGSTSQMIILEAKNPGVDFKVANPNNIEIITHQENVIAGVTLSPSGNKMGGFNIGTSPLTFIEPWNPI